MLLTFSVVKRIFYKITTMQEHRHTDINSLWCRYCCWKDWRMVLGWYKTCKQHTQMESQIEKTVTGTASFLLGIGSTSLWFSTGGSSARYIPSVSALMMHESHTGVRWEVEIWRPRRMSHIFSSQSVIPSALCGSIPICSVFLLIYAGFSFHFTI